MRLDEDKPNWPSIRSHPAEDGREAMSLENHLLGVAERTQIVVPSDGTTTGGESLSEAMWVLGIAHDIGKSTEWFQRYIDGESPDNPTHHSRFGAFTAYYALEKRGYDRSARLGGLFAVALHHGHLKNAVSYTRRQILESETWTDGHSGTNYDVIEQVKHVDDTRPEFARAVFEELLKDEGSWSDFKNRVLGEGPELSIREAIQADVASRGWFSHEVDTERFSSATYVDALRMSSALVFADKTHAAGITKDDGRLSAVPPKTSDLQSHIDGLSSDDVPSLESSLNDIRADVQQHVVKNAIEFVDRNRSVASITLPTGYGKTFAGLLAALSIRDERNNDGRIVYALPFTSIIDQTTEVIQKAFDASPRSRLFSVHHHLAETITVEGPDDDKTKEEDETDQHSREDIMLAESWRAGLTLTTFVQLFESLAGPCNTQSMKLSSLYGSVVIVDEPQTLPIFWWPLVRRLIAILTEDFSASVILMTATQPLLVEDQFELIGLDVLAEYEQSHFEGGTPTRVEYDFQPSALSTDDELVLEYDKAARRLVESTQRTSESVLAVCNTIDSARELTEAVEGCPSLIVKLAEIYESLLVDAQEIVGGYEPTEIVDGDSRPSRERAKLVREAVERASENESIITLHLTTRLRPCDRKLFIAVARDLSRQSVPFILVSTQLVEAGVDVSFDQVFRDFGPLDSIVQAAGRCNRSFERAPETGTVTVWKLAPPGDCNIPPSVAVYARTSDSTETDLLTHTRRVLTSVLDADEECVTDSEIARKAITSYHSRVGEAVHSVSESNPLVQALSNAAAGDLRSESLIDQHLTFEVYVCRTEAELGIARELNDLLIDKKYEKVEWLRKQLAPIRVSVPVYRSDSEAARELAKLEPLGRDPKENTERILPAHSDNRFDVQLGIHLDEVGVEDRFY